MTLVRTKLLRNAAASYLECGVKLGSPAAGGPAGWFCDAGCGFAGAVWLSCGAPEAALCSGAGLLRALSAAAGVGRGAAAWPGGPALSRGMLRAGTSAALLPGQIPLTSGKYCGPCRTDESLAV